MRKLREGERLLNKGKDITEVVGQLSQHGRGEHWNRWRSQCGGMNADEAERLRQLESENARLEKLLAEAELDKAVLRSLAEANFKPGTPSSGRGAPATVRGPGTPCPSGDRPAPLHPSARARRTSSEGDRGPSPTPIPSGA